MKAEILRFFRGKVFRDPAVPVRLRGIEFAGRSVPVHVKDHAGTAAEMEIGDVLRNIFQQVLQCRLQALLSNKIRSFVSD